MEAMPRTSERISQRDLEVLEFIARYGTVPRGAVCVWAATARSVSLARERRLRLAGLIETRFGFGSGERLLVATRSGLRACGRPELGLARPSPSTLGHETVLARVGAGLERGGERLLSEREIIALERAEGGRRLSAALPHGRFHRADLIRLDGDGEPAEAIEVELSSKGAARLDAILRAWRLAVAERRLAGVVYYCTPRTRRVLERAIERTRTEAMIAAVDLRIPDRDGSPGAPV
jgi:hypothetical protein